MGVCDALDVRVRAREAKAVLGLVGGLCMCTLFGVVVVLGEIVFSVLLVCDVVVSGIRFLRSGRMGVGG